MKKINKDILFAFTLFFLQSCYSDVEDLTIMGTVIDKRIDMPIENASIKIICWKYGDTPDGSYTSEETVITTTNSKGEYEWTFGKGAYIEVETSVDGYKPIHEVSEVHSKNVRIDLMLIKK